MMRALRISKFRNIGLEQEEELILNGDLQKDKLGDLVILIGPNNAGKSNVLNALLKVGQDFSIQKRDITDLSFDDEDRKPKLTLLIRDDKKSIYLNKTLEGGNNIIPVIDNYSEKPTISVKDCLEPLLQLQERLGAQYGMSFGNLNSLVDSLNNLDLKADASNMIGEITNTLNTISRQIPINSKSSFQFLRDSNLYRFCYNGGGGSAEIINNLMLNEYGIRAVPKIISYQNVDISSNTLYTDVGNIEGNNFFVSLFKISSFNVSNIRNAYEQYNQTPNPKILEKLERQIKPKIEAINKRFNDLYFAENDKYHFSLKFENNRISFGMSRGDEEDPINLDFQSVGFKWFFNLYFSNLMTSELRPGDIVVMDEPAHNLHPKGQVELRKFLKEFAKSNGLTIVIATHSPFMIDVDNFDELRIVSMNNNRAKIDNLFSAVNGEDPDSLLPIKESLTIKQNVLYDYDTEVCWVEGITDYIYLTMFKKLLGIKNLSFLPMNGVGKTKEQTKKILSRVLSIRFFKYSMLVDADKAGNDMASQCKGTAFGSCVHQVSELADKSDKKYITIEDLFSEADKKKFKCLDYKNEAEYKKSYLAASMKRNCSIDDFSKETIKNFESLFELLED